MGGQDKPLMTWGERSMVEHVLASVPSTMPKLISANRNVEAYGELAPVIEDQKLLSQCGVQPGPLVGVLAGLQRLHTEADYAQEWLLVCPGDTPCLADDWWEVMQTTAKEHQSQLVVAHDGERQQHLHMLVHKCLVGALSEYLHNSQVAVFRWLELNQATTANFSAPAAFRNINQPEDLEAN